MILIHLLFCRPLFNREQLSKFHLETTKRSAEDKSGKNEIYKEGDWDSVYLKINEAIASLNGLTMSSKSTPETTSTTEPPFTDIIDR